MAGPFAVDASVFINAFVSGEEGHDTSRRFLERLLHESIPTVAPTLLLPEVAATIRRGRRDAALAREFANALVRLPHLSLVRLDQALAEQAADIAAQTGLRGSDSVYVTVAMRFGATLVTLDREQRERAVQIVPAVTPTAALSELA